MNVPVAGLPGDAHRMMSYDANKKTMGVAYLLWFFLGLFGGHRFYAGKTGTALLMLATTVVSFFLTVLLIGFFTLGMVALWALIDAFLIPDWIRSHNNQLIASLSA